MLVLARRVGESIVIDGQIRVTILAVEGERARIGIETPRSVPVVRQELYDAVIHENRQAAQSPAGTTSRDLLRRLSTALPALNSAG